MNKNIKKINLFISYSHKNKKYKEKLFVSLEALKQSYNIETWQDGEINAGGNIDDNIKKALNKANIVLLLITDNFLASYYCMKIELEEAIKREEQGKCIVIPVMFQEAVLTDNLSFIKNNRVPEDGKAIATGFRNQSMGCTRAVKMIQQMIDKQFPNCKKRTIKTISPSSIPTLKSSKSIRKNDKNNKSGKENKDNNNTLYFQLYEDGKLSNIEVTQNMIDLIPKYHSSLNEFRKMMDQSLLDAKKRYSKLYKQYKGKIIPETERLNQLKLYLMDICAYTKTYITENVGIKAHFRVSKDDFYVGIIASTDDSDDVDLSSDWTTKMTPIPMYQGLIYFSSKYGAPFIKSLNMTQNFKATHNDIWKDYVTFTFPKFHTGQTPLISYCISVHRDYYKVKGDLLIVLAYLNFGEIIEQYVSDYCDICKNTDKNFSLENIINAL